MIAAWAQPIAFDGRIFAVGVSAGIAFSDARTDSAAALFAAADAALYAAKHAGRGRARVA